MGEWIETKHVFYPDYKFFLMEQTEHFYKLWGRKTKRGRKVLLQYKPNLMESPQGNNEGGK